MDYRRIFSEIKYDEKCNKYFKNKWILNSRFDNCIFRNLKFENTVFSNVTFHNCRFINVVFINIKNEDKSFLKFSDSELYNMHFERCNLRRLYINQSILELVDFKNTYMTGTSFIGDSFIGTRFIDECNLMDSTIEEVYKKMEINFVNGSGFTKLNYGTFIGNYMYGRSELKDSKDFLEVSNSYMNFENQFNINRVGGKYGICFYEAKKALHFTLSKKGRFKSYIYNLVCGYGEKPVRSFFVSILIVLFFAILYLFIGINTSKGMVGIAYLKNDFSFKHLMYTLLHCFYFSMVTFATVGYGDILPVGIIGEAAVVIEVILGIIMVGVWTSTLIRKMTR